MGSVARILVADDLAREQKQEPTVVLRLASDLAGPLGAELHLVHAYALPELSVPTEAMSLLEAPYVQAMAEALESEAESIRKLKPSLRVVPEVQRGHTVDVILRDIEVHGCQLVVLGTHGRHGVKRALLGSVAEEVIRRSPVPVLSVNPHTVIPSDFRLRKTLVPVDVSDSSSHVVDTAAQLARTLGMSLVLISVVEQWVYPVVQSASLLAGGFVMPLERDLQELASLRETQLREIVLGLEAKGVKAEAHVIERASAVGTAIVEQAKVLGCDLIAMGHRHASRIEYAISGSVSRFVVREASCPVLTIPPRSI